jgi:hypothetical protein
MLSNKLKVQEVDTHDCTFYTMMHLLELLPAPRFEGQGLQLQIVVHFIVLGTCLNERATSLLKRNHFLNTKSPFIIYS